MLSDQISEGINRERVRDAKMERGTWEQGPEEEEEEEGRDHDVSPHFLARPGAAKVQSPVDLSFLCTKYINGARPATLMKYLGI